MKAPIRQKPEASRPSPANGPKWLPASSITFQSLRIAAFLLIGLLFAGRSFSQLKGTYTIDSTKSASNTNYQDLRSAITDLDSGVRHDGGTANGAGISGSVVFKFADGVYTNHGLPNNPSYIDIFPITGSSAANTVTFTSASGDSSKVFLSNFVFILYHCNHIIFSKIGFRLDYNGGSTNLAFSTPSDVTVTHCLFQTSQKNMGIFSYDTDSTSNLDINHNNFQGTGISILLNFTRNIKITDNIISNVPLSSGLSNGDLSFFSGFGDRNILIQNNTFLRNVDSALSISTCKNVNIFNNRIQAKNGIIMGADSTADSVINNVLITHKYGISIYNNYYNNSNCAILNNNIYTDSVGSPGTGACIYVYNSYMGFGTIMNNNFQNGLHREALHFTSTKFSGKLDYNNYYSADSLGYFATKYTDFKTFQSATGYETNGRDLDPKYDFSNYLKTGNKALAGKGKVFGPVKYDIQGNARISAKPTIGAYEINYIDSTVWPGDANNDGKADINDVLPIGLAYGDTGPKRTNASTNWTGQACSKWTAAFKNGVNYNNADGNGDGTIDSTDLTPIALNFSKTHSKASVPASGNPNDPPLAIHFSQDSVQAGDTVTALITLGSSAIKANNIYGVTISIGYGGFMLTPKKIQSDFNTCWLGTLHKNMVSLVVNDSINKVIYIGLTRTDHSNASGNGEIGTLSIYMPDNVAGKREVKQLFNLNILAYKSINSQEGNVPLNPISDSVLVYQFKNGIATATSAGTGLAVYPNPAASSLHIKTDGSIIRNIEITDMMGKTIGVQGFAGASETSISLGNLPSGVYFLNVMTRNGNYRTKFIKK